MLVQCFPSTVSHRPTLSDGRDRMHQLTMSKAVDGRLNAVIPSPMWSRIPSTVALLTCNNFFEQCQLCITSSQVCWQPNNCDDISPTAGFRVVTYVNVTQLIPPGSGPTVQQLRSDVISGIKVRQAQVSTTVMRVSGWQAEVRRLALRVLYVPSATIVRRMERIQSHVWCVLKDSIAQLGLLYRLSAHHAPPRSQQNPRIRLLVSPWLKPAITILM